MNKRESTNKIPENKLIPTMVVARLSPPLGVLTNWLWLWFCNYLEATIHTPYYILMYKDINN